MMKAPVIHNKEGLIKALRKCGNASADRCLDCDYYDREPWCESALVTDAADALESAEKRIAELEVQLPKEGEWIKSDDGTICSNCGFSLEDWIQGIFYNYCPNCGSRMRKGEQE